MRWLAPPVAVSVYWQLETRVVAIKSDSKEGPLGSVVSHCCFL